jgi:AhpC/TSA family/Methyltransferase domain
MDGCWAPPPSWQAFIEGGVYDAAAVPWRDDPAFALLREFPGLQASVSGRITAALAQTMALVRALTRVDILHVIHTQRPARGLCLGFGMNVLEPYDLLQACALDVVHAYEWIGEQVLEAAQALAALPPTEPALSTRLRLHHGSISHLQALTEASIHLVYAASVFNHEIPMTPQTLSRATAEILRVLAPGGFMVSRGSAGVLEERLAAYGRPRWQFFRRDKENGTVWHDTAHLSRYATIEPCLGVVRILLFRKGCLMPAEVGDQAPDFTMPSTTEGDVSLSQYRGQKHVILSFHVLDFTSG